MKPSFQHPLNLASAKPLPRAFLTSVFPIVIFAAIVVFALSQSSTLHAQTPEPSYSESEAQTIDRMLMCPVCPAETIDQAQVEISRQMRDIVREMLGEGKERDEILDFFVERYGKDILAAPPKSGANLVAWLLPIGGFIAALVGAFFIIRSMARKETTLPTSEPSYDAGLAPYLQLVDRHLEMSHGGTSNLAGSVVLTPGTAPSTDEPNTDESD